MPPFVSRANEAVKHFVLEIVFVICYTTKLFHVGSLVILVSI